MIESLFYFLVFISLIVFAWAIYARQPVLFALAGVLILSSGLILSSEGIKENVGYSIHQTIETTGGVTDVNVTVDENVMILRPSNDLGVLVLSNLFVYGGLVVALFSIGFYTYNWRRGV